VGSPDSLEGTETTRSLDVTDHTDDLHGRALNDGAGVVFNFTSDRRTAASELFT
jgi:hypothetical protein